MNDIVDYVSPIDTKFSKADLIEVGYSFSGQGFTVDSDDNKINTRSMGFWLSTLSSQAIRTKGTYSTGGLTAQQIYENHVTQVLALPNKPGYVMLFIGGTEALSGGSLNDAITWATRSIKELMDQGITVILPTLWAGASVLTDTIRGWCVDWNEWVTELSLRNADVILMNYASVLVDPDSATGDHLAGYLQVDDTHPASLGSQKIAQELYNGLSLREGNTFTANLDDTFGTYKNLVTNSTMTGTSGTTVGPATGDTADSWVGSVSSATLALSKQSAAAGDTFTGDWQRLALTSGSNSGLGALTQTVSSGFEIGKKYYMQCEVNLSVSTQINSVYIEAKCKDSGASTLLTVRAGDGQDNSIDTFSGVIRTLDFTVPSDTATIDLTIAVLCDSDAGGSGAATLDVRRTVLKRVYDSDTYLRNDNQKRKILITT